MSSCQCSSTVSVEAPAPVIVEDRERDPSGRCLGQGIRPGIELRQLPGECHGCGLYLRRGDDQVREATATCLVRIEQGGVEDQLLRLLAAGVTEELDREDRQRHAHPELGGTDPCTLCHHPLVTGADQDAPAGDGRSVDGSDGRLRAPEQAGERSVQCVEEHPGAALVVVQDLAHVEPGGEHRALSGHHQGPDLGILLAAVDVCGDLLERLDVECVDLVTGERQHGDPVAGAAVDPRQLSGVRHGRKLPEIRPTRSRPGPS